LEHCGAGVTDARLPGRFLTDYRLNELSDSSWRLLTCSLMWSNEQGTDGFIPYSALRLLGANRDSSTVGELIDSGVWSDSTDGYFFVGDWESFWGQSLAVDVESRRASNRQRQKMWREKVNSELATARNQGSVTRYVGQERKGRQGEEGQVDLAKRCLRCGAKTSTWITDLAAVLCIRCQTDENPL